MRKLITSIILITLTFSASFAQQNVKLINAYLGDEKEKKNLLESDITGWLITDQYTDKSTGITHIYIQQRHNKIAVYNGISNFAIKGNKIVHFSSGIIDHLANKVNAVNPVLTPEAAFNNTLAHLEKSQAALEFVEKNEETNTYIYNASSISHTPVRIQLVYRQKDNNILLAWDVSVELNDEPHWWNVRVDALTGNIIDKNDYTKECVFESAASLSAIPDYNVFAFPVEAPSFGGRSLVINPSDPLNSPYGWHDVDGVTGEEYTTTRGNNVHVYEDADNNNIPGYEPNGGATLHFDFPYNAAAAPATNMDASLTNLFYVNNRIHDFLYPLGFDEVSGNFQFNNYGNGGAGNDHVKAEGFDGGGTNNANFSTPPDGYSGRMQMYLWSGNTLNCTSLNVSSSTFTGSMPAMTAEFSPITSVTGKLILVNDGSGTLTDACSAITNNIAGKIALIDRGSCTFVSKAQAAIAAGAIGVIIANNSGLEPTTMSGSPVQSVPVISISMADGVTLKNALQNGLVDITINTCVATQIDGSFDNGVITHEYGHGLSNRLTGGPSQAGCLGNGEQGGEGWSDWLALIMTIEPGDQGINARGVGTYAKGQTTSGSGIRRFPYSTDMGISPLTYGDLAANTEVHATGEIWCNAIWDMSWFLIDNYGFSNDPYNTTAGNTIAIRLVLEGMKLQPCGPGFLDARDAILMADAILYNNAHRCLIWQAFARRGMGFLANQGSANVAGDETENFTLPPYCLPPTQVPEAEFTSDQSTILCGNTVKFTDQSVAAFDWAWEFGDGATSNLQNPSHTYTAPGSYNVKLTVTNPLGSDFVIHTITVNPAFSVSLTASPTSICSGEAVQLNAEATGTTNRSYIVSGIPYAPLSGTLTTVTLNDDQVSTSKPIGFTFNFFGQNYNNFYISSNGLITFNAGTAAQPVYGEAIPNKVNPNNFIALAWNDINPQNAGSTIGYFNTGLAPNRKLIVSYNSSHYGGTQYPFIVQAILYEGSNNIEIHTTTISDASPFDDGATTTQGVENANGSRGVPVPGRNGVVFAASNDAYLFTPYIPYTYTWLPGDLDGATQVVNPTSSGVYTLLVNDGTECTDTFTTPLITVDQNCGGNVLNLQVFLEGFYRNNGNMEAVLFNLGLHNDPTACDSITVELHSSGQPSLTSVSQKVLLHTDGFAEVTFPPSINNGSYYIVIIHRNSIDTWSKFPVLFDNPITSFDFTEQ